MGNSVKKQFKLEEPGVIAGLVGDDVRALLEEAGGKVVGLVVEGELGPQKAVELISQGHEGCEAERDSLQRRASLGDVVAGITHQSRNIMTGVLSFAQLARHRNDDSKLTKLLENIENESTRCVELMNQILTLARSRDAATTGNYECVGVAEIMSSACSLTQPRMAKQKIMLENSVSDSALGVSGDKNAIRDVFVNLLRNATDATPEGGTIRVTADQVDGFVVVLCEDSGTGVLPEHRSRVFEASFTTKRAGQGTGLGLAVSKQVIIEHKGDIAVEGSPLGGARFVVRLPTFVGEDTTP
jgi:signal transduction histidine kinase